MTLTVDIGDELFAGPKHCRRWGREQIRTVTLDQTLADSAADAYRRFGKGRHPAGLNFGNCFSYALAIREQVPLLFKGDDFSKTDVMVADGPAT